MRKREHPEENKQVQALLSQVMFVVTANYLELGTIGLAECIRQVVRESGWKEKYRRLPEGRGVGLACSSYLCGAGTAIYWNNMPHSGVQLQLDRSGLVTVFSGAISLP